MNNTCGNKLQKVFDYEGHKVRTVLINGEPYFVAKDLCDVLEIGNPTMALTRLRENEKGISSIETLGGVQQMSVVNETGMYLLIMRSRKPEAEAFSRWIASEVLPANAKQAHIRPTQIIPQTIEAQMGGSSKCVYSS